MDLPDRSFWKARGFLLVAVALVIASYLPDGMKLWEEWSASEEFNHGPLMLAVALYLLWKRRALFLNGPSRYSWFGIGLVLVAALIYIGSIKAAILLPRHYAFLLMILGLFALVGGKRYVSYVLPSLVLLVFVIPPPGVVSVDLTWGLQLLSSDLSVILLRAVNITVFQDGNIIDLGTQRLEVAEACAGLRYLYPMMGLGVLIGMLFDISWIKRLVFLLIAAVVAVLMNSVRIFLTGAIADMTDLGVSEGFFHLFEGWVFFIVTFTITLVLCWLVLNKKEWNTLGRGYFVVEDDAGAVPSTPGSASVVALALVLLLTPLSVIARNGQIVIPDRTSFISFPLKLDGRIGTKQTLSRVEQNVLKMTDYFLGSYETPDKPPVSLFIGYFEAQSKGQAPHSPRICIPGGGWKITSMKTINVSHNGTSLPINRVVIAKERYKQLVYYWFQQGGNSYANSYQAKINTLWRGIVSSRTDGALVRLVMPLGENITEKYADQKLARFSQDLMDVMPSFVPN